MLRWVLCFLCTHRWARGSVHKKRYRTGLGRRFWGQAPPQWHTAQRIFIETGSKMHGTRPLTGCLQGCYGACRGGVMQDLGYELPRILIPRTSVNKGHEDRAWIPVNPESPSHTNLMSYCGVGHPCDCSDTP